MNNNRRIINPTLLDLHTEQTIQSTVLKQLSEDTKEIKEVLVGSDQRQGMVMDVDRLKQSRLFLNAVMWIIFTTLIGGTATVVYATFLK